MDFVRWRFWKRQHWLDISKAPGEAGYVLDVESGLRLAVTGNNRYRPADDDQQRLEKLDMPSNGWRSQSCFLPSRGWERAKKIQSFRDAGHASNAPSLRPSATLIPPLAFIAVMPQFKNEMISHLISI